MKREIDSATRRVELRRPLSPKSFAGQRRASGARAQHAQGASPRTRHMKPARAAACQLCSPPPPARGLKSVWRASLLAFRKAVGYTRRASSQAGSTGAVQTRFESRQDSISHPAETRRFFAASRATVPRLLMRCLKPLTAAWGARFGRCDTRGRPHLLARVEKRQAGGRHCARDAIYARAPSVSFARRPRLLSRGVRR